jgi:hypothetical protein
MPGFLTKNGLQQILTAVKRAIDKKVAHTDSADEYIYVDNTDPQNPLIGLNADLVHKIDLLMEAVFPEQNPTLIENVGIEVAVPSQGNSPDTIPVILIGNNFSILSSSWYPEDDPYDYDTVYTFSITLEANEGYTFTGIDAEDVKINDNTATIVSNSGNQITLSFAYETEVESNASAGWELTYTLNIVTPTNYKILLSAWDGYNGQVLDDEYMYDDGVFPNEVVFPWKMYAKFVTYNDEWRAVRFDNYFSGSTGTNSIFYWGVDGQQIYIYGSNSTSNPFQLKLVYEGE